MFQDFLTSNYFGWIILRVISIILITMLVTKFFTVLWAKFGKNTIYHKFIKNILSVVIWIIGIIMALSHFPQFATATAALLAGSGIIALTVGLAAQESLGNAFNGLFISISKPFEVGDRIHLVNANITGFVEDISIRHTVVRTFTNSRIIIPNSVINKELIENSNFCNPQASSFIDIIIVHGSDVERAREIMAKVIGEHAEFVDTRTPEQLENDAPKVPVFVRSIGLYGIELRASMWTSTVSINFAACSDVRKNILHEFGDAEISLASTKFVVAPTL